MNTTDAIELITRKLDGTLTEAEGQQLEAWLARSTANRQTYRNLQQLYRADWGSITSSPGPEFFAQQHQVVRETMAAIDQRQRQTQLRIQAAAVLVLAMLASVFIYGTLPDTSRTHLTFNHATMNRVAAALSGTYHVHIEVDAAAKHLRFTGDFVHEDLDTVLVTLARSLQLTLQHHGNTYVLLPRHAS